MEITLGSITLFPFNYQIRNWMRCEGQTLTVNQYQALFYLIGDKFGGDMHTYFNLPDLREKSPVEGLTYYIAVEGVYPTREYPTHE